MINLIIFILISQNWLQNSSFENWTGSSPDFWNIEHPVALPVQKESLNIYDGNYSVKINRANPGTDLKDALTQEIPGITGGTDYFFSGWILDNNPYVYARIQVNWYKDTTYLTYSITSSSTDSPNWQLLSALRTSPDTANRAVIKIKIYGQDTINTGFYFCDLTNFSLPASVYERIQIEVQRENKNRSIYLSLPFNTDYRKMKIYSVDGKIVEKPVNGIYFIRKKKVIERIVILGK